MTGDFLPPCFAWLVVPLYLQSLHPILELGNRSAHSQNRLPSSWLDDQLILLLCQCLKALGSSLFQV